MAKEIKTYEEFGRLVKSKYPEYGGIDDFVLAERVLEQYPEYRKKVKKRSEKNPLFGGVMDSVSKFMFGRTGEFVGGDLIAPAIESLELLASTKKRDAANQMTEAEFKKVYPALARSRIDHVDMPSDEETDVLSKTKRFTGGVLGSGLEVGSVVAPALTGSPATAAMRIGTGTALGGAAGLASGLYEDALAAEIALRTGIGAGTGAAISSATELLALAGDKAAKALMNSALGKRMSNLGKVERLVDDDTLAMKMKQYKIKPASSKKLIAQLDDNIKQLSDQLDEIGAKYPQFKISGDQMVQGDDMLGVKSVEQALLENKKYLKLDEKAFQQALKKAADLDELYAAKVYSWPDFRAEKSAVGARVGSKAFSADSEQLAKLSAQKVADKQLYYNMNNLMKSSVSKQDQAAVNAINADLSALIDARSLFEKARGISHKMLKTILSSALAATVGTTVGLAGDEDQGLTSRALRGAASGLLTGGAAYGGAGLAASTFTQTMGAALADNLNKTLTGPLVNSIMNRVIIEAGDALGRELGGSDPGAAASPGGVPASQGGVPSQEAAPSQEFYDFFGGSAPANVNPADLEIAGKQRPYTVADAVNFFGQQ